MALNQARGRLECSFNGYVLSGTTTVATATFGPQMRLGQRRNMLTGMSDNTFAVPNGHLASSAYFLPQKPGGMSSVNEAVITFTETGNAAQGLNRTGAVTIVFTADADGAAIASGTGSTSFAFASAGTTTAPLNSSGSATIVFTTGAGASAIVDISASDSFAFSSSMTTGALGFMTVAPLDTGLSAEAIAVAVWEWIGSPASGSKGAELAATLKQAKLAAALSA